jgi:hypothetical protein
LRAAVETDIGPAQIIGEDENQIGPSLGGEDRQDAKQKHAK